LRLFGDEALAGFSAGVAVRKNCMERVAIIGAGFIGSGWAIVFARAGYEVALYDQDVSAVDRALETIGERVADLERSGLVQSAKGVMGRLVRCNSLPEALEGAVYAQESVPEVIETKTRMFREMDAAASANAILASSASRMVGSKFLGSIPGRHRCLIAHPANPPYLMPVVELVPSPWSSQEAVDRCSAFLQAVGQVPVRLYAEIDGFVMNRLQTAVVSEAIQLVAAGVVSPEGLDKIMRYSLGLRWSFMGPFETMDLNAPSGFKDYVTRYGGGYERVGKQLRVADPWPDAAIEDIEAARRAIVPGDHLGDRRAWRDRRLIALLAHIAKSDSDYGR
jgi:L-gulonate 3-dehydrogenase